MWGRGWCTNETWRLNYKTHNSMPVFCGLMGCDVDVRGQGHGADGIEDEPQDTRFHAHSLWIDGVWLICDIEEEHMAWTKNFKTRNSPPLTYCIIKVLKGVLWLWLFCKINFITWESGLGASCSLMPTGRLWMSNKPLDYFLIVIVVKDTVGLMPVFPKLEFKILSTGRFCTWE